MGELVQDVYDMHRLRGDSHKTVLRYAVTGQDFTMHQQNGTFVLHGLCLSVDVFQLSPAIFELCVLSLNGFVFQHVL